MESGKDWVLVEVGVVVENFWINCRLKKNIGWGMMGVVVN